MRSQRSIGLPFIFSKHATIFGALSWKGQANRAQHIKLNRVFVSVLLAVENGLSCKIQFAVISFSWKFAPETVVAHFWKCRPGNPQRRSVKINVEEKAWENSIQWELQIRFTNHISKKELAFWRQKIYQMLWMRIATSAVQFRLAEIAYIHTV